MTTEEIHTKLATIITQKVNNRIPLEQIQWNTRLRDDLGIDSLAVAELLYEIEAAFGTTLDEVETGSLLTVGDAVNAIAQELQLPMAS